MKKRFIQKSTRSLSNSFFHKLRHLRFAGNSLTKPSYERHVSQLGELDRLALSLDEEWWDGVVSRYWSGLGVDAGLKFPKI